MNQNAYARLKEQIRLRQLRAAVATVEGGPTLEERTATDLYKLNELTEAIKATEHAEDEAPEVIFHYNKEQQSFIDLVVEGEPVALTGPAGSGKTTAVKGAIRALIESGRVAPFGSTALGHKWLQVGAPGIVCTAFTNKAVENMKKVLPKELRHNCITIHKLLEYGPVFTEYMDEKSGEMKRTMNFLPKYDEVTPLPAGIQVLIIDEASMVAVDLWNVLARAIHHRVQVILIGDIQQLPPVFGKPIFIYAMQRGVAKVELVEVHRQALESPIIALAHKILEGKQIPLPQLDALNYDGEHGKLLVKPWKKALSDVAALHIMRKFLPELINSGGYDPMTDVILTPFNVNFGTEELNKIVASYLVESLRQGDSEAEEAKVYEIFAGIKTKYFRVGDKVLYNKTEHIITSIMKNSKYFGKHPRRPTVTMDYYGRDSYVPDAATMTQEELDEVDDILLGMSMRGIGDEEDASERKNAASHILELYSDMLDTKATLETAGEVGNLELGYAITVHKSQGSEYNRVLFITHHTQASMLFRELIYTAVTRAKRELVIVCPPNLFVQGINSQRIPGKSLAEKVEAFDRQCKLQKGVAEKPEKMHLFLPQD